MQHLATGVVSPQLDEAAAGRNACSEILAADDAACTRSTSWPCSRWASTPTCSTAPCWWRPLAAVVGVRAAVHRLRDQGAQRAAAHVVARCPRRSADADLDDPGRRAAEDGRLRHHPHLLSDLPAGRLRPGVRRLRHRRRQHGLRCVRRDGPDRLQAAGRLQLGEPHGLRRARPRRVERGRRQRLTTRTTGRWA